MAYPNKNSMDDETLHKIDKFVLELPDEGWGEGGVGDVSKLASVLTEHCGTPEERARSIFTWITRNQTSSCSCKTSYSFLCQVDMPGVHTTPLLKQLTYKVEAFAATC